MPKGYPKNGRATKKSKMSTLHLMDVTRVSLEIRAKGLLCEIPECGDLAIGMADNAIAAILCSTHYGAHLSSPVAAIQMEVAIRRWMQYVAMEITSHAYEGQDGGNTILVVENFSLPGKSIHDALESGHEPMFGFVL